MAKKLWIDDLRDPPDETWEVVRTAHRAICLLEDNEYDEVSFDNDLGFDSLYGNKMLEGRNILGWLRARHADGLYVPGILKVHSANPKACEEMEADIQTIRKEREGFLRAVQEITPENRHPETDWGKDEGKEILDRVFGHDSLEDKPRE